MTEMFSKIDFLGSLLDVKMKRHQLISNNLANVDTPGYKRYDISFEELLKSNLNRRRIPLAITNEKHIDPKKQLMEIKPKVYRDQTYSYRNDGNNVDIDKEMVEMAKNTISYNIISEQINKNFKMLQTVISEGRK
ncbi:MAG TPA: flagellar basal body rod protein FlgB [Thermoanaerobacterales bacterium]|nr:flagellar basal body rod protein FlgB [Thermoanaerobacterales bacterium]